MIDGFTYETVKFSLDPSVPLDIAVNPNNNNIYIIDKNTNNIIVIEDNIGTIPSPSKTLKADFIASDTFNGVPMNVNFTNLSTGEVINWLWEFGNGQTSTDQSPIHIYNGSGIFSVKLTVSNLLNTDIREKEGVITVLPSTRPIVPSPQKIKVALESSKSSLKFQNAIVTVLDQNGRGISDIKVKAFTSNPLTNVFLKITLTDENGAAQFRFRFGFLSGKTEIIFVAADLEAVISKGLD